MNIFLVTLHEQVFSNFCEIDLQKSVEPIGSEK